MLKDAEKLPDRLAFLEGMRGFAALYVMFGHFCSMSDPKAIFLGRTNSPQWLQVAMTPFWFGHLAVASFLVISGFCLQLALFGRGDGVLRDLKSFFRRRAMRILPTYYACLVLSLVVCSTITTRYNFLPFTQYVPVTPQSIVAHVLLIHNWNPAWMYKINGVLWSIAIEAQLYLLFPALVKLTHHGYRWILAAGATLLPFLVMSAIPGSVKLYPWYLALFVFGIVAAHMAYRPNLRVGPQVSAGWLLSILSGFACIGLTLSGQSMFVRDLAMGVCIAATCYSLTLEPSGPVHCAFSWRPLVQVGAFSYSLYLVHHPVLQVLYSLRPRWAVGEAPLAAYFFLCSPVILAACYGFHLAFEKPFMRKMTSQVRHDAGRLVPSSLPLRSAADGDIEWCPAEEPAVSPVASRVFRHGN